MKAMVRKIMAAIMLIGILCTMFTGCGKNGENAENSQAGKKPVNTNVLNFNDYVRFDIEGTNGYGVLDDVYIDYTQILADYADKLAALEYEILEESEEFGLTVLFSSDAYEEGVTSRGYILEDAYRDLIRDLAPTMDDMTYYELYDNEYLKNGMKIEIKWIEENYIKEAVEKLEKLLDIKVSYKNFTYKIDNLPEVVEVDPFALIELRTYGRHGEASTENRARVYIEVQNWLEEAWVTVEIPDNNGSLCNGDILHVYIEEYDPEAVSRNYGIVFSRTEADIEIRGLNGDSDYIAKEPKIVDLSDYADVDEYGFDGYGRAGIEVDYERFILDNRNYFHENVSEEDSFGWDNIISLTKELLTVKAGYRPYNATYDKVSGTLKNGDVITFTWEEDTENLAMLQKLMNVKFENTSITYTMGNLDPITEKDPFEEYSVVFEGKSGEGTASGMVIMGAWGYPFEVISENNGSLSNGDVIVISIAGREADMLDQSGVIPTRTELEVVVSGLE